MSAKTNFTIAAAVALLLLLGGVGLFMLPHRKTANAIATPQSAVRIQARIDGRSRLVIHGSTLHWSNFEYNLPGQFGNGRQPTYINGATWDPSFTTIPGGMSLSDDFTKVNPPLPVTPTTVTITPVEARGPVRIVQQPNATNLYTLIIEFDDSGPVGAADYVVDISFPGNPPEIANAAHAAK